MTMNLLQTRHRGPVSRSFPSDSADCPPQMSGMPLSLCHIFVTAPATQPGFTA